MPLQFWLGWQGPGLGFSIGLAWSTWTLSLLYSLSVQREASCWRFFNFLGLLVSEKLWVATIWQIDFISADHTFRDNKRPRMFGWTSNPYKLVLFLEKQGDDWFFYMCSLAQKELVKNIQCGIKVIPSVNLEAPTSKFGYEGPVHDASKSFTDIKESGEFLRLSDAQVLSLKVIHKHFKIYISIWSIQNRVKIAVPIEPIVDDEWSDSANGSS